MDDVVPDVQPPPIMELDRRHIDARRPLVATPHLKTRHEAGLQAVFRLRALHACPGQNHASHGPPSGASDDTRGLTTAYLLTNA